MRRRLVSAKLVAPVDAALLDDELSFRTRRTTAVRDPQKLPNMASEPEIVNPNPNIPSCKLFMSFSREVL